MAPDPNDWNQKVIEEFRANEGRVGPPFEGTPVLLLHTTGAKSGQPRLHPVVYRKDGENLVIFASKAGAPVHPSWYHNLLAHPRVQVEVDTRTLDVAARVATGEERERLWAAQTAESPGFAGYQQKTTRQIPVVVLEPTA